VWIDRDHIPSDHFWEVFAPDSFQEQREQVRRKHNKEYWLEKEKSLQELSLQTYSTKHYRSIDSIEILTTKKTYITGLLLLTAEDYQSSTTP